MVPRWLVQVLHPPQKFERPPFWNGWKYGIRKYRVEVTFNGMTSLLNFIKIYQLVQKLLGGTHRQTDRQTGDLVSLTFLFKESRLKKPLFITHSYALVDAPSANTGLCIRSSLSVLWKQGTITNTYKGNEICNTIWIHTRNFMVKRSTKCTRPENVTSHAFSCFHYCLCFLLLAIQVTKIPRSTSQVASLYLTHSLLHKFNFIFVPRISSKMSLRPFLHLRCSTFQHVEVMSGVKVETVCFS
jgi:hypothetical protein